MKSFLAIALLAGLMSGCTAGGGQSPSTDEPDDVGSFPGISNCNTGELWPCVETVPVDSATDQPVDTLIGARFEVNPDWTDDCTVPSVVGAMSSESLPSLRLYPTAQAEWTAELELTVYLVLDEDLPADNDFVAYVEVGAGVEEPRLATCEWDFST